MFHHYITKYRENGKLTVESWIQLDFLGFCRCFSRRRVVLNDL